MKDILNFPNFWLLGSSPLSSSGPPADPQSSGVQVMDPQVGVFDGDLSITINATGALTGDMVYWTLTPASDAVPSALNVREGQAANGDPASTGGSGAWPGPFANTLPVNLPLADYFLAVIVDNGALSNVGISDPITLDTVSAVLSTPLVTVTDNIISWSVTSNESNGTVYAALRAATDNPLSADDIINGAGNTVSMSQDATAMNGSDFGADFPVLPTGTYVVDMVHEDGFENRSSVLSSTSVSIAPSAALTRSSLWSTSNQRLYSGSGYRDFTVDLTTVSAGDILVLSLGSIAANAANTATLNGDAFISQIDASQNDNNRAALLSLACPASAAGNGTATLRISGADPYDSIYGNLDHIQGAVMSFSSVSDVQPGGASGGTCSASINTTTGGLLYAVGTSSLSNGFQTFDVGFDTTNLNAVRGVDDSFLLAVDTTPTNSLRTVTYDFGAASGAGAAGYGSSLIATFISAT